MHTLDNWRCGRYNKNMLKTFAEYISPNGIYYHHSISVVKDGEKHKSFTEAHALIELLFLISGQVDYSVDGSIYRMFPGDLIVVNAQELHTLYVDPSVPYERIMLQFSPNFIPKLLEMDISTPFLNASLYRHIIPKKIVEKFKIERLFRAMKRLAASKGKYKDVQFISMIIDLIAEINMSMDLLLTSEFHLIPTYKSTNEILRTAIKYINDNLTKNITTEELTDLLGISPSYLYRFFKMKMGISLHQYIHNQKMQLAYSLINQGYQPQNVAHFLGYEYYSTFFTQFKRTFKKTPSAVIANVPAALSSDIPLKQPDDFKR